MLYIDQTVNHCEFYILFSNIQGVKHSEETKLFYINSALH